MHRGSVHTFNLKTAASFIDVADLDLSITVPGAQDIDDFIVTIDAHDAGDIDVTAAAEDAYGGSIAAF